MFEELKKSFATLKKAKDEANKRRDELQSTYQEFKSTILAMWKEACLGAQKFKLKNGELVITEKEVSIATSGGGLTHGILEEATAAVGNYFESLGAKYDSTWAQ